MNERPDFIALFLDSLKHDYKAGGTKRLIPFILVTCYAMGFAVSLFIPPTNTPEDIFPFIAALITAQGIILAMSMQTSGMILNNISQGGFSVYLKQKGLLSYYMLLIQFIQIVHLTSLFLLLATAAMCLVHTLFIPLVFKTILALGLGSFLYALRWAWGTTTIVRDLIHFRGEFEYNEVLHQQLKDSLREN
jgi:hypothetical protein